MAPPPRPPIICYDLQTNTNARRPPCRVPLTGTCRKTKVTVVQRNPNELNKQARASACSHSYHDTIVVNHNIENHENTHYYKYQRPSSILSQQATITTNSNGRQQNLRPVTRFMCEQKQTQQQQQQQLRGKTIRFPTTLETSPKFLTDNNTFLNNLNARFAYGKKLRHEAEERERWIENERQRSAMLSELDETTAKLEACKRYKQNWIKSCGMGHNTAEYVQKLEEEIAELRRKVDQSAETRSWELGRRSKQMQRLHQLQQNEDRKVEDKRRRDMQPNKFMESLTTNSRNTLLSSTLNNSLSSPSNITTTNTASTNTASSSSTISISSCSSSDSSMSLDHLPSIHFVEPSPPPPPPPPSATKTPSRHKDKLAQPTKSLLAKSSTPAAKSSQRRPYISDISRQNSLNSGSNNSSRSNNSSSSHSKRLSQPRQADDRKAFSFYKGNPSETNETLEITDTEFFERVEDKTMMEINQMIRNLDNIRFKAKDLQQLH